eukprot:CAMPEP_0197834974 /NCGR_PEP_ID=MMETSP1437-20131217/24289_1 /TAXON_ID=49252 ORGANISM="Eucampia antarctica, Strain CCMP1452" /NCGR_SAMPLE_ID=MMETSP1437 /ASSEMBLY_ACC=CAM_ASM_001096 /LENGTH=412 /DNA_ID=CAMNT_0043440059 /DNA_START=6 /DNA_END=1244 /DNA_ORIENTATION=+
MGEFNEQPEIVNEIDEHDDRKVFCSRVPAAFNEDVLKRLFEENFGTGCVENVTFLYNRDDEDNDTNHEDNNANRQEEKENNQEKQHRGFAFIVLDTVENRNEAVKKGTVRGGVKPGAKRKHTIYVRPIVRDEEAGEDKENNDESGEKVCFLWKNFRCPYGDECKFAHDGEGSCKVVIKNTEDKKKKQKCFAFKKKGNCKAGDSCPFLHELGTKKKKLEETISDETVNPDNEKKNKDCINWKNKGKCRKGDKCTYRHDESVREALLLKKSKKQAISKEVPEKKERQPLSVRVFGLNYDTTEIDIREYFKDCGPIVEVTFPTFEDSSRSKGYCGVLFQSPKAIAKAVEMDGMELHGRWLSIQAGKMYLKQWEKRDNERTGRPNRDEKSNETEQALIGEYGQKVKRRKTHGFKDE